MESRRALLTIAVIAISVVIAAMFLNGHKAGGGDEAKVLSEEKRLITINFHCLDPPCDKHLTEVE